MLVASPAAAPLSWTRRSPSISPLLRKTPSSKSGLTPSTRRLPSVRPTLAELGMSTTTSEVSSLARHDNFHTDIPPDTKTKASMKLFLCTSRYLMISNDTIYRAKQPNAGFMLLRRARDSPHPTRRVSATCNTQYVRELSAAMK